MRKPGGSDHGLELKTLIGLWIMLVGLAGGAYVGLPVYMDSLDERIVFRSPDCMDVAQERARSTSLDLAVRGDSLEAWTKTCLGERQEEMARHGDLVGYGTMGTLIATSVLLMALILRTAFSRLSSSRTRDA